MLCHNDRGNYLQPVEYAATHTQSDSQSNVWTISNLFAMSMWRDHDPPHAQQHRDIP